MLGQGGLQATVGQPALMLIGVCLQRAFRATRRLAGRPNGRRGQTARCPGCELTRHLCVGKIASVGGKGGALSMPGKTPMKGSEKKKPGKSIKERRKEKRLKRQREDLLSHLTEQ